MLQNATLSGNLRPALPTSLMNMSLVLRLPCEMHLSSVPRLPSFLKVLQNPHVLLTFDKAHNPLRLPRKTTSERPKVLRTPLFFPLLTWKCAPRHNGVHFFDISTKVVRTWCVLCILTSKCALRHNNFQKCSDILTWKCASRHSGAHFFDISASKSAPRLRCFVHVDLEMCFGPQWRATFHPSSGQMARHPPL